MALVRAKYLFVAFSLLLLCGPAHAESRRSASAEPQRAGTEVVVDQEQHVIRFLLDGAEVMRLDSGGLKLLGDISYSGALSNEGEAGIKAGMEEGGHAR